MRRMMILAAVMSMSAACSSENSAVTPVPEAGTETPTDLGDGGAPPNTADAPARCRELVTLFCDRAVTCTPSDAGTTEDRRSSCVGGVGASLRCEAATGVGATFDTCVTEMPKVDCARFVEDSPDVLPPSCRGVIAAPPAPAAPAPPADLPGAGKPNVILGRSSGSDTFDVYLGCLCDADDPDSVLNAAGLYGPQSGISQESIWNRVGPFGSDFSSQSACNEYAIDPPVVVNNGQISGRLTRNRFAAGAIADPAVVALLNEDVCVR